jgi:DNA-binding transcriptional LysR family regulator
VEIRLRQAGSGALAEEVAAGRLDLAFAVRTQEDSDQLRSLPLTSEPMTVLCHPSHPLADGGPVSPEDLGGEAFVDFHPDWGPRRTTDMAFAEAGVQRTVTLEVSDVHSLLELVHEGLGVAVVPRHFGQKREASTLVSLPVKSDALYETVAALPPHEATSPAARALMGLLAAETEDGIRED